MSEKRITGTVKWFDPERRYGFIEPSYNFSGITGDIFVHADAVVSNGEILRKNDIVTFQVGPGKGRYVDRKVAVHVLRVEKTSPVKGA
jgi:cold shock CspA family protein